MDFRKYARTYARFILPAIALIIVAVWLYLKSGISEEERVLKALEKTRRTIEGHSIIGFIGYISPGYRDHWGHRKDEIKAAAFHVIRTFPVIEVDVVEPKVTVEGEKAGVVCYARMTVGKDENSKLEIGQEFTNNESIRSSSRK